MAGTDANIYRRLTGAFGTLGATRLLDRVAAESEGENIGRAWPWPRLVSLGLLRDRQKLLGNWDVLGHVLIAAPTGAGADVALTSLLVSLAAARPPSELGFVLIAAPRTWPEELGTLPHLRRPPVHPADPAALAQTLAEVRAEVERRASASAADPASCWS